MAGMILLFFVRTGLLMSGSTILPNYITITEFAPLACIADTYVDYINEAIISSMFIIPD